MRKKVEVGSYYDLEQHAHVRGIYINGEFFDWGIDPDSIAQAKEIANSDSFIGRGVEGMIQNHFVQSFSQQVGWPVTLPQVVEAIRVGWIEREAKN